MTASQHCPHCGNTVKPALTRNRRRRRVENDQYADFLRRAISGYTRRVGQGDIDAIASFSALVAEAGEQLAEAVFLLRVRAGASAGELPFPGLEVSEGDYVVGCCHRPRARSGFGGDGGGRAAWCHGWVSPQRWWTAWRVTPRRSPISAQE